MSTLPAYLLADSQPLFWTAGAAPSFLEKLTEPLEERAPLAAYIGAANGDRPEFFQLFEAAMERAGVEHRRMIHADFPTAHERDLRAADIILLAGGDVELGREVLVRTGMAEILRERYFEGAILLGVSAGAVHLGLEVPGEITRPSGEPVLGLIPYLIDVHDERQDWTTLRRRVRAAGPPHRGLGVATGAGVIYHPDHSLEPLGQPALELAHLEERLVESLLLP